MASRKSSASFTRAANVEQAGTSDALVFTGARPVQPNRQPHLPPPIERQKDEGFARFLKKHTSPTHNRVTARGRIVPIEPRSPPPFALPSNVTNRPQAQSADQVLRESAKRSADLPWTTNPAYDQVFDASQIDINGADSYMHNPDNLRDRNDRSVTQTNMRFASPYGFQTNMSSSVSPERAPLQAQLAGGPVMPPAAYAQTQVMPNGMQNIVPNFGVVTSVPGSYMNEGVMDYSQQTAHSFAAQQGPTLLQTLIAWEQHYAQLDQQLKDIDRHRAMSNLDPRLAEQRRVIVQQRSDAKDTVHDLRAMLGIKRRFESSQSSWNPSFNVEAPVYVPQSTLAAPSNLNHRPSFEGHHAGIIEKPRGHGQRRAIPIVPPPENGPTIDKAEETKALQLSRETSSVSERWSTRPDSLAPRLNNKSSRGSDQMQSSALARISTSRAGNHLSGSSTNHTRDDQQSSSEEIEPTDAGQLVLVYPANDIPPSTLPEEYIVLIEAINRPKGTISKVRLLDNRVIDVEGQGLGLTSSPGAIYSTIEASNSFSNANNDSHATSVTNGTMYATPMGESGHLTASTGKENVSVAPKGHQKAATDAFLAQFNAVENNTTLSVRAETQSLRTASNSQLRQLEQKTTEYYQRGPRPLASRENLPQPIHHTSASESKHGLAYSVADEKVFEGGEGDYLDSKDALNTKGYSITSVQNIHAIGSLPNSFDGAIEARQSFQAQLNAASKSRSPRFLRRLGANGGA